MRQLMPSAILVVLTAIAISAEDLFPSNTADGVWVNNGGTYACSKPVAVASENVGNAVITITNTHYNMWSRTVPGIIVGRQNGITYVVYPGGKRESFTAPFVVTEGSFEQK